MVWYIQHRPAFPAEMNEPTSGAEVANNTDMTNDPSVPKHGDMVIIVLAS